MSCEKRLTEEDARSALRDHVAAKAHETSDLYGTPLDRDALERLLLDPAVTRWPTELRFDGTGLRPGEFGFAAPVPGHPEGGWAITLHPQFEEDDRAVVLLATYHLVSVNYGEIASHEEAEVLGSVLCGFEQEDYYRQVCDLADRL